MSAPCTEPLAYRTVFYVRADYDNPHLDFRATWDDVGGLTFEQLLDSRKVTERITGEPQPEHEAVKVAKAVQHMGLRKRFNPTIEGGWVVTSDTVPTDEELIEWWKQNRSTVKPHV